MPRSGAREQSSRPDELTAALDAVEARLLGQNRTLRRREVSSAASISLRSARRFWRALGFPLVSDEDVRFTRSDLYALRGVVALVRDGVFDEATALAMTRAVARTTDRLAVWQAHLMAEAVANEDRAGDEGAGLPDREAALAAAMRLAELADDLEPLLVYAWRRHLAAALSRMVADAAPNGSNGSTGGATAHGSAGASAPAGGSTGTGLVRTVGFADLVSFTRLVRQSSERQLARIVSRFEALASDVVTAHGGQVVKTVGDEVMYLTQQTGPAALIALDLVEAMTADDLLPDLRVGVATGQVVPRLGDVFGTTVNRASRLTAVARPRGVLVDAPTAEGLAGEPGITATPAKPRTLRGLGQVTPFVLTRRSAGAP